MMTDKEIQRINALARKSRTAEGLTEEEQAEQAALRAAYVAAVKESLTANLDNVYIQEPDGTKRKLPKKER